VILILIDALRRDHVGAYGYPRPTTPYLDSLAADGVVFLNAYAQAPQTLVSTSTLLTSRYFPWLLRGLAHDPIPGMAERQRELWAKVPRLADANLTLAEVFQDGGYQTMGLFTNPHHHPTSGFWQGFEHASYVVRDADTAYGRVTKVSAAFLEWYEARDDSRPYFAYLHLMDVHNPYRPPPEQRKLFPPGEGRHVYVNGIPEEPPTAADLKAMQALYDGEIRFVDDTLRSTLGPLQRRGELANTVIVVTSDHGDEFMDHGGLGHGKTVELELLKIPVILAGAVPTPASGQRFWPLVRNLDLAPTLLELAAITIPDSFEGTSLVPWLTNPEAAGPLRLRSFAWNNHLRSLTTQRWHLAVDRAARSRRLYDLKADPTGTVDVLRHNPETVARLGRHLHRLEVRRRHSEDRARILRAVETGATVAIEDSEILDQLRALGYVDEQ
jgi:arylsulfatase A-like enzyme